MPNEDVLYDGQLLRLICLSPDCVHINRCCLHANNFNIIGTSARFQPIVKPVYDKVARGMTAVCSVHEKLVDAKKS